MYADDALVQYLIEQTQGLVDFSEVRFSTQKVAPDYKPYPKTQVVIFLTEDNAQTKTWQGRATILTQQLCLVHTYSKSRKDAKKISKLVCEILDGSSVEGLRSVSVNAFPREISYNESESLYYANVDVW